MRMAVSPYSSLSPHVEKIYGGVRGVFLVTVMSHVLMGRIGDVWGLSGWYLCAAYAVSLVIPWLLVRLFRISFLTVFWPVVALDIGFLILIVQLTGGTASNLYVLYYLIAAFAGYHISLRAGMAISGAITVAYITPGLVSAGAAALPDLVFRMAILWFFAVALSLAARAARTSTLRLLSAMDKLNERTSELEATHTQLQTIYETARSLAQWLVEEDVIDRVLTIARTVLNYPVCEVYTWDRTTQRLTLKGRVGTEGVEHYSDPRPIEPSEVFRRVILEKETARVVDRHLGRRIVDGDPCRSQLVVPMISEGNLIGLLCAESPQVNAFGEHDERVLSILAGSTALALVNADLHRQMEKLTVEDELTGLHNFRYFRTRLEDEKRRAVRYDQPLSLIMIDIDWFKKLNDRHGHEIGNLALKQVACVIAACVRDVDVLARYGGEEFIVILPHTGTREAQTIGERIRRHIEDAQFGPDAAGRPIHITASIGVSCYPENGVPEDDLVESVDQALYRAKGAGKNIVQLSGVGL